MGLPLAASDERNRFGIQLYHRTATQADLSGKQVLEVSCGHGGGACSYFVRTLRPASYTGLDFNADGGRRDDGAHLFYRGGRRQVTLTRHRWPTRHCWPTTSAIARGNR
jgi:hypothetical protein